MTNIETIIANVRVYQSYLCHFVNVVRRQKLKVNTVLRERNEMPATVETKRQTQSGTDCTKEKIRRKRKSWTRKPTIKINSSSSDPYVTLN